MACAGLAVVGWTLFATGSYVLGGTTTGVGNADQRELAKYERWVQELRAKDDLIEHVKALALEISANAPLAVQGIKRTINYRAEQGLQEAMQFEAASASVLFTSDDMTLGYAAMAKKEDANFEGK